MAKKEMEVSMKNDQINVLKDKIDAIQKNDSMLSEFRSNFNTMTSNIINDDMFVQ